MIEGLKQWIASNPAVGAAGVAGLTSEVARMELAESGIIGATKPRLPLCFMRATCCFADELALINIRPPTFGNPS